jgi:hypothetical protein
VHNGAVGDKSTGLRNCEAECREHEDKHLEGKECAEACAKAVSAIEALSA